MIKPLITTLLLLISFSCKQRHNQKAYNKIFEDVPLRVSDAKLLRTIGTPTSFNIPLKADSIIVDSLAENINFLKLELTNNSAIGNIDNIFYTKEGKLIVVDKDQSKRVFIFDSTGKYIARISDFGTSTNQYHQIANIAIDDQGIILLDDKQVKLFYYNFKGELLKVVQAGVRFREFTRFQNGSFLLFTNNSLNDHLPEVDNYCVLLLKDDKIEFKDFYIDPLIKGLKAFGTSHVFSRDSFVYVFPRFSDTVFRVLESGVKIPAYRFVVNNLMPSDYFNSEDNRKFFRKRLSESNYCYFMGDFLENDSHIITNLLGARNTANTIFIDKKSGKVKFVSLFKFSTAPFSIPSFRFPITVHNNRFVTVLKPESLLRLKKLYSNKSYGLRLTPKLQNLITSFKEYDNPIIMTYTLKSW